MLPPPHTPSFPGCSQMGPMAGGGERPVTPATKAPHALPVVLVLPQGRLIGVIGSCLCQARCKVPCGLFKFILWILVGVGVGRENSGRRGSIVAKGVTSGVQSGPTTPPGYATLGTLVYSVPQFPLGNWE